MKIYIKQHTEQTADGDTLKVIETYFSEPEKFDWIAWV